MRRIALILGVIALAGAALLYANRRTAVIYLMVGLADDESQLLEPAEEPAQVRWFDDYYTVELIDAGTIAIGEPRFSQQNYSYLILGTERALLFDSGPGLRDIGPVVASLTELPVTAVPSHLHYDHIGNLASFDRIALVDLPDLRARVRDGVFVPTDDEFLGGYFGHESPALRVGEWWEPGAKVDLGDRSLEVLHTPGHTPESISLYDARRSQLFTGDYINEGVLFAFLPGSGLGDYLRTAERLVPHVAENATLLTGHRTSPPRAPLMSHAELVQLRDTLRRIRAGDAESEGFFPQVYRVHADLIIYSDFAGSEDWDAD